MTWPTTPIGATNLDAGSDSPASARADLKAAVDALNAMILAGDPTHGRLLAVRVFTVGTTYTPTAGTSFIVVEGVGGGGGGGSPSTTDSSHVSMSGSGASGAYAKLAIYGGFSGAAIVIGAAGSAGAAGSSGSAGGSTTFGGTGLILPGGPGGTGPTPSLIATGSARTCFVGSSISAGSYAPSGTALTGPNTLSAIPAAAGGINFVNVDLTFGVTMAMGVGGSSPLGRGGGGSFTPLASGFGAGGGGGFSAISTAGVSGGAGSPGVLIIYEYA